MSREPQTLSEEASTHWGLALLLAALTMVSPFSLDTFFPAFPAIAAEFSLSDWQIQQSLTVYMVPFALMVLVQGPLSDALGRRPVVLVGLMVYAVASAACVFAPNYATLLACRALQGMSAGVGVAVGRAIIRDLHEGPAAQRLMSTISMIFGIAPALAPVIGGWIHVAMGWRGVFGFMVLLAVALIVASWLRLPETHPEERRARLQVGELARTTWSIAQHREFMLLAIALGIEFSTLMTFIGAAPAIVLEHWSLSETQFAWLFVPIIVGLVNGAWMSGRLAGRVDGAKQVVAGFILSATGASVMFALHSSGAHVPLLPQVVFIALLGMGMQLVMPVVALRMLDLFPLARGSAASVQTCLMLLLGAMCIGFVVPHVNHSLAALSLTSLIAAVGGFAFWRAGWHTS